MAASIAPHSSAFVARGTGRALQIVRVHDLGRRRLSLLGRVDEPLDVDRLVSSHDYSLWFDSVCNLSESAVQSKHVPFFSSATGQSGSDWILPEAYATFL